MTAERGGAVAEQQAGSAAKDMVGLLERAINDRDLEGLVRLFREDVVVEYPAHPSRTFHGRDQIWRNWAPIMAKLDDFRATVVRSACDDTSAWVEWLWQGTQADGSPGDMAGVVIHELDGDQISHVRFYLEPVDK
jgi:ketosteroid isomerase-like protein